MKYTVTYSCGHNGPVELYGKGSERERKLEWYATSGLCPECYKQQKRKEEKEQGLLLNYSICPYVDSDTGEFLVYVWFSGDTMSHKEVIKNLGYSFEDRRTSDDMFSFKAPKVWGATVALSRLNETIQEANAIGAIPSNNSVKLMESIDAGLAIKAQEKWQARQNKIQGIKKPAVPELIKGHKWNKKIYERSGSYSIYLDGNKTCIDDATADNIIKYVEDLETYLQVLSEIE